MREKVEVGRRGGGWQHSDPMKVPDTILLGVGPFQLFLFREGEEGGRWDGVSSYVPFLCRKGGSSMTFSKNRS